MILCPVHGLPLGINFSNINFLGQSLPTAIGTCSKCKTKYINVALISNTPFLTVGESRFEVLPSLAKEFPINYKQELLIRKEEERKQLLIEQKKHKQKELELQLKAKKENELSNLKKYFQKTQITYTIQKLFIFIVERLPLLVLLIMSH